MSRQFYFSDQQETNLAFVLNVPNIRAVEPAVPLLTYAMPCSAPRSSGRFDERLSKFVRELLYSIAGENPRRNMSLTASFAWLIAGDVKAENRFWLREEKNAAVTTIVPVVTSNMGTIESDPCPEPFDLCKRLKDASVKSDPT